MRITFKKQQKFLTFFVNFWPNQIQNCSSQIKKMKVTSAEHYWTMRDIKMYPLPLI